MADQQHKPTWTKEPWDNDTTRPLSANDARVLINGHPPRTACRVLSEENYQRAVECVNAMKGIEKPEEMVNALTLADNRLGTWMSAALEDDKVCDSMKKDINKQFEAIEPFIKAREGTLPNPFSEQE